MVDDAALASMRKRNFAGGVIARLAVAQTRHLADQAAWRAHLTALGITGLKVHPDPVKIATEGALWGAVTAGPPAASSSAMLRSSGRSPGQFNIGTTPSAGSMPSG